MRFSTLLSFVLILSIGFSSLPGFCPLAFAQTAQGGEVNKLGDLLGDDARLLLNGPLASIVSKGQKKPVAKLLVLSKKVVENKTELIGFVTDGVGESCRQMFGDAPTTIMGMDGKSLKGDLLMFGPMLGVVSMGAKLDPIYMDLSGVRSISSPVIAKIEVENKMGSIKDGVIEFPASSVKISRAPLTGLEIANLCVTLAKVAFVSNENFRIAALINKLSSVFRKKLNKIVSGLDKPIIKVKKLKELFDKWDKTELKKYIAGIDGSSEPNFPYDIDMWKKWATDFKTEIPKVDHAVADEVVTSFMEFNRLAQAWKVKQAEKVAKKPLKPAEKAVNEGEKKPLKPGDKGGNLGDVKEDYPFLTLGGIPGGSFALPDNQFGGFDPKAGIQAGTAILSDIEAFFFIQAAQGDNRVNLLQAPKVSLFPDDANISSPFIASATPKGDFKAILDDLRTIDNTQITIEVRFITLADKFFERIGIDFDFKAEEEKVSGQADFVFKNQQSSAPIKELVKVVGLVPPVLVKNNNEAGATEDNPMDLTEAVQRNLVDINLVGDSKNTLVSTLVLTNPGKSVLFVIKRAFLFWLSGVLGVQNMMNTVDPPIRIAPGETLRIPMETVCVSTKNVKPPPPESKGVKFSLGSYPEAGVGEKLIAIYKRAQSMEADGSYASVPINKQMRARKVAQTSIWMFLGERSKNKADRVSIKSLKKDLLEQFKDKKLTGEQMKKIDGFAAAIYDAAKKTVSSID